MLGLVLLYFLCKKFYQLAEEYEKSKWGFAILGVITYYAGTFIVGLLYEILSIAFGFESIEKIGSIKLSLIALPFGLLLCYLLYILLEKNWKKNKVHPDTEIDKIGTFNDSNELR